MRKLSMTGVVLCGALVSGCLGEEWEQPAHEQPGGTGTEASVASTRQAVISPALEASLACVETYANAGTCDWAHWSELWEACATYEHAELEDGFFLDEVQSGNCTAANWPALREQLITPRPPLVRVRVSCNGISQVIQEAESNGCYTLAQAAGASWVDVPIGKAVTLHAGVGCTGASVTVQTDTNLCGTSFGNGTNANDNVRSFRIQDVGAPPSEHRYDCAAGELTCVENDNIELGAINRKHTVKVVRVTLAGRTTPSMDSIVSRVHEMYDDFFAVASHNQVGLASVASQTVAVTAGSNCEAAKKLAVQQAKSSAFLTVYSMPSGLCPTSRAGERSIYLNGNLLRDYTHETGHVLGLAHGNAGAPLSDEFVPYGDSSTYMGKFSSDNYNLPQLHWLGWTKKEELIKVNSAIDNGGYIDVTLRPVGSNAEVASSLPLGAVWEIPNTEPKQRLFIAVPKPSLNATNQIEGGTVIVYLAPKCEGCTGMNMGTWTMARFSARSVNEHAASGLFIKPVGYTSSFVQVDGQSVEVFTSVTVRIRR
ncbi:hypothetical protein [Pyxidicoccus sp. MSG2]|uniref:hypothetical protein n=1 Tax=Pyxidicoccus sp. MSG2 TaxID=2996790 RepID=UPI0022719F25|nr:hypothetical protein [Pyxidicoccus sp. MSG2]MCY1022729.1 hypothetical protein [Pyxidicoccus sp. MSG2]